MGSIDDIMQLCRLCLVKDQVNIPIFDETSDIRQTFLKINQCLPVKVSRDDNLPKKICDGCSYKLDMLYVFRNTSVDSEKQLLSWLSQTGLGSCSLPQTVVKDGVTKPEIMVKQETFEASEARIDGDNPDLNVDAQQDLGVDAHTYIMQQQKLPYQQDFAAFGEPSGSTNIVSEEPAPKKPRRAAMTKKHVPIETEEDTLDTTMQITKAEEEDSDDVDQPDYVVEAPSASADDQPGPSGVGKGTIEAPFAATEAVIEIEVKEENEEGNTGSEAKEEKTEVNMRSHRCRKCNMCFGDSKLLRKHRYEVHQNICWYCKEKFKETYHLVVHSEVHAVDNLYPCTICDEKLTSYFAMIYHKKEHEDADRFCFECNQHYEGLSRADFKKHLRKHSIQPMVSCKICDEVMNKANLRYHMKAKHNPASIACHECGKRFDIESQMRNHVRRIHENRIYLCDVCGKSVTSITSLHQHLKTHTGEKPFACDRCGKRFMKYMLLKIHLRVHTKEKPHTCEICKRRFSQRSSLTTHIKTIHNKEKRHVCLVCNKAFGVRSLLNTHMKCHEKKGVKAH